MPGAQGLEVRAAPLELRVTTGRRLQGYAAVFHSPATIGAFQETIVPGAFRTSLLSGRDALLLADHDPAKVLARSKAGSLRMVETGKGLHFEADVANTSVGNDVLELVRSGNAGGMSFGFRIIQDRWPTREKRELVAVELHEISVVSAWPAYPETEVHARSLARPPSARLMLARRYMETMP
jgi:HK97 family phage prohead protease